MGHKYHDAVRAAYYTPDPEDLKKVYITLEHVTISERLPITMEDFQKLKIENSRLCDIVSDMKKEIKELKGEA